ncbi:MAG: Blue-light-activated protein [Syntrophorhabdus sp. PtaU1.Bin058]|nr:MAG: Blue-light-activated protein [Syntrophorhabdus sp. PtaU1.Bin058]
MRYKRYLVILLFLTTLCGFLLYDTYRRIEKEAIGRINNNQTIYAKQAGRSIKGFFKHYLNDLRYLSMNHSLIAMDGKGKEAMNAFYRINSEEIWAVTRVGAKGRILYTVPYSKDLIGKDLSPRRHFREAVRTGRPVISDVFMTSLGRQAVSVHMPLFKGKVYAGSIAVLIPFESLTERYVGSIKILGSGYAWMISASGIILHSPFNEYIGKTVFEVYKRSPEIIAVAGKMMNGEEGTSVYTDNGAGGNGKDGTKYHAIFLPIPIGNTFWSIAVATPEDAILRTVKGFRNRWLLIMAVLISGGLILVYFFVEARAIIIEEENRREANEALRRSEAKYRELVEDANSIILRMDVTGVITFFNEFSQRFFGYGEEEITGKDMVGTIVPDNETSGRDLKRLIGDIGRNPDLYINSVNENIRKNGERVWVAWTNKPVYGEDGKVVEILCVGNDITERKKAEEDLRASERKYRSVIENIQDVFYRSDVRGRLLMASPSGVRMFGYGSVDEMIGLPLDSFWLEPAERQKLVARVKAMGAAKDFEAVLKKKDGTTFNASLTTHFYYDDQGGLLGTEGIIRDITNHKRMEEALRESEERYRIAIENSNDGVAIMKGTEHVYVNKKFVEIFGYTNADEIIGKPVSLVVHPDDSAMVDEMNRKRQGGEPVPSQYEFKGIRKDGTHVDIEISAAKTTFLGETVSLVYLRDVTDRRHLQFQLLQAQKMEAIGTLTGGIAHDFNNILTALIGYSNLLLMKMEEDDPLRVYVEQMLASSEKAANLTQSLLAFSRKQLMELKPNKVNAIIRGIEKLLKRLLTEDIDLRAILSDRNLTIMADLTQMDQVLLNLATNARDAMPKGGVLTVETQEVELNNTFVMSQGFGRPGRYVLISVSDTGIGMDAGTQERIFDPFFTTKDVGKGTGLGLSTVYGIIKQHNGYISVESEPGHGTTFRIYLPMVEATVEDVKQTSFDTEKGTETILLAEDNTEVRKLAREVLLLSGYSVIEAIDGEDAVRRFIERKDSISLIILDVVMPKKNGKEVYEAIRKIRPDIKVLFTSGYTGDIVLDKGIHGEEANFITKPLSPDMFLVKIREILDR